MTINFSEYKDINDFYQKTGMTPQQANNYLLQECKQRGLL